mmetsp:Transcript_5874/g.9135  ORF Transcript_5874/g.9135 Transcript_5874/m.9135 type:complete len:83 (+) Transcript_5874:43-291(+)
MSFAMRACRQGARASSRVCIGGSRASPGRVRMKFQAPSRNGARLNAIKPSLRVVNIAGCVAADSLHLLDALMTSAAVDDDGT